MMAAYDADPTKQLQIIMTQKWIQSFGNGVDDILITGEQGPIIFDPNDGDGPNHCTASHKR
jgi:hypothetical protein